MYANVEGLAKAYRDANVLRADETLTSFIQGFNKEDAMCDFTDAGKGKECTDFKLRGEILVAWLFFFYLSSDMPRVVDVHGANPYVFSAFRAGYLERSLPTDHLLCFG